MMAHRRYFPASKVTLVVKSSPKCEYNCQQAMRYRPVLGLGQEHHVEDANFRNSGHQSCR